MQAGGNLLPGFDMISDANVANDGNGRDADASDTGDWLTLAEVQQKGGPFYRCDTAARDSSWHGTQTSGLIGALTNDGIGMASVGRNVRVLPVRALGKCGGFDSDIIAAMLWASGLSVPGVPVNTNPARVLNLSLGSESTCSSVYRDAIEINAVGADHRSCRQQHRCRIARDPGVIAGWPATRWNERSDFQTSGRKSASARPRQLREHCSGHPCSIRF